MSYDDIVIAVTSHSFSSDPYLRERLLVSFPRSRFNGESPKLSNAELKALLHDADGAIIGTDVIDANVLQVCPRLQVIAKYGVGVDNIDFHACADAGIHVGWTPGVNRLSVAEQTLGFMLCLSRNLYSSSLLLKQGIWKKQGGMQLSEKRVGIIGLGHVGREVVRLLQPFRCSILVNDIMDRSEICRRYRLISASKERIFREADFVTIHTPLTPETRHLVNLDTLSLMKPSAFLINTSRGAVVNQAHLKEALQKGVIAGVAMDVYEDEPPTDRGLLSLPNVFCTPHIGGNAKEAIRAMGLSAIEHVKAFFGRCQPL
ncbi:MAG: hydroxyacid dehydrogenase [Nitrospirae bacterium]|nr:MAG: hydroxyacid dehydrogenase [Nitrospirota bacterium]